MKYCPNCGNGIADEATFCPACGNGVGSAPNPAPGYNPNPNYNPNPGYAPGYNAAPVYPAYDPYDHTSEFDPKDISENKIVCMLIYLGGFIGVIIGLLMANTSKYVGFHIRQFLKLTVATILLGIIGAVGSVLLFIPTIVAGIMITILSIVQIICFFQVCKGQAKEPAIVRGMKFMK